MKHLSQLLFVTSLLLGIHLSLGCRDDRQKANELRRTKQNSAAAKIEQDNLTDAWSFLAQLSEADESSAADRVAFHLNSWLEQEQPDPTWQLPTGLMETLKPFQQARCKTLDDRRFLPSDLDHLRIIYLLSHIAEWATAGELHDGVLKQAISKTGEALDANDRLSLERACRLFDWTIRNIQLEPFDLPTDGPRPSNLPFDLGFRVPGYRQTPFETVWHGSGDSLQRSRVFIQLCRQIGIDACMVGIIGNSDLTPWVCGTRIGQDLFLFEPQLGLPIPGPGQEGIATLHQAQEDASVLRRLNVTGWFDYPIGKENVAKCVALIDATPETMSWRMTALEQALTGDLRLRLTIDVGELPKRLNSCRGIVGTGLWSTAIDAEIYHEAIVEARKKDVSLQVVDQLAWGMLRIGSPLAMARWQHLVGEFEPQDVRLGAYKSYQAARMTEADIDSLSTNVDLQILHAVQRRSNETPQQHEFKIGITQQILRSAKLSASCYLGLALYDQQRFDSATTWLNDRYLQSGGHGAPQASGAQYVLARAYENLNKKGAAIEIYKTAKGTQEHGNRLRARLVDSKESGGDAE